MSSFRRVSFTLCLSLGLLALVVLALGPARSQADEGRFQRPSHLRAPHAGATGDRPARHGATFPIVIDTKAKVAGDCNIIGLPSSCFINQDGELYGFQPGIITSEGRSAR